MSARSLYICVDESGAESVDEYFTVASCWFSSTNSPRAALNEAKVGLRKLLVECDEFPSGVEELKGKNLGATGTDLFFQNFHSYVRQDNTIEQGILPWTGFPVRYRTNEIDVATGRKALSDFESNTSVDMSIRTLMLLTALNPIMYNSRFAEDTYDRVRVLLDGGIWSQAKRAIENTPRAEDFEFSIRDSKKVPGIQFADVAANLRFTARKGTSYTDAPDALSGLEF
jgi:hypothetical protein